VYADADAVKATPGFFRLVVEDQGIGFEEKYLDRIFTVFQRLHSRAEYPGTGVGLAICRKIAERHGGEITAKSTLGQGTAFLITLPVSQGEQNDLRLFRPQTI
jgi:signal transduction histidine kinase